MMIYLFFIYIISLILSWKYIQIIYSEKGIYYTQKPDFMDLLFVIFPILNTSMAINWIINSPYNPKFKDNKTQKILNYIFKVK